MKCILNNYLLVLVCFSTLLSYDNKFTHLDLGLGKAKVNLKNSPVLEDVGDGYTRLVEIGDGHLAELGMPELPEFTTFYQLDPSKLYNFQFEVVSSYIIDNIDIVPHQGMEKWEIQQRSGSR